MWIVSWITYSFRSHFPLTWDYVKGCSQPLFLRQSPHFFPEIQKNSRVVGCIPHLYFVVKTAVRLIYVPLGTRKRKALPREHTFITTTVFSAPFTAFAWFLINGKRSTKKCFCTWSWRNEHCSIWKGLSAILNPYLKPGLRGRDRVWLPLWQSINAGKLFLKNPLSGGLALHLYVSGHWKKMGLRGSSEVRLEQKLLLLQPLGGSTA